MHQDKNVAMKTLKSHLCEIPVAAQPMNLLGLNSAKKDFFGQWQLIKFAAG